MLSSRDKDTVKIVKVISREGECQLSLALDCSHYPAGSKLSPGLLEVIIYKHL